jgi:hypothetical protein
MAGILQKTAGDAVEFFEVQSDGWWMWVASVLRATGDAIERICVGTWGVSSGGHVSDRPVITTSGTRFRDKEIESRFTKLG